MNRYLIFCRGLGFTTADQPTPEQTLHRAIKGRGSGMCGNIYERPGLRIEVLEWLVEHDIDHFLTVEKRTFPYKYLGWPLETKDFHLVILTIPNDNDAFHLRLRYSAKPLDPNDRLDTYPVPVWRISE